MEPGEVNLGGLLVAGGDAPPLLEAIDASLDGVPLLVSVSVKHGWSATVAAASRAVGPLVGRDRNHGTGSLVVSDGCGWRGRNTPYLPGPLPAVCGAVHGGGVRAGQP